MFGKRYRKLILSSMESFGDLRMHPTGISNRQRKPAIRILRIGGQPFRSAKGGMPRIFRRTGGASILAVWYEYLKKRIDENFSKFF
jgi:hypothetical protein